MWWKVLIGIVLNIVADKRVIAWILNLLVKRVLRTPARATEATDTARDVLEAAAAALAVCDAVVAAGADRKFSVAELEDIETSAVEALEAWGEARRTPDRFRALWRNRDEDANGDE